ncbi:MAG: hypothetical protein RLZZ387_905 [Chloroflexota bacterium]
MSTLPHRYTVGAAVYHIFPRSNRKDDYGLLAGRVVRIGRRLTIETPYGRKVVTAERLAYQGYCPRCEVPAHAGAPLVCPQCGAAAEPVPPPLDVIARLLGDSEPDSPVFLNNAFARALVLGASVDDGRREYHRWRNARRAAAECDPEPDLTRDELLAARAWLVEALALCDELLGDADGTGLALHHRGLHDREPRGCIRGCNRRRILGE